MTSERTVALSGLMVFLLYALLCILFNLPRAGSAPAPTAQAKPTAAQPTRAKMRRGAVVVPVSLSAKIDQGLVTLSGTVPDESARMAIVVRARSLAGEGGVVADKLTINPELVLTQWFDKVLTWFPPKLGGLHQGEFNVSGASVTLLGYVATLEQKLSLGKTVADVVGPTATLYNALQINPALRPSATAASQEVSLHRAIEQVTRGKPVEFEPGSDMMTSNGRAVVEQLVPLLKQFPGMPIEINGQAERTAGAVRERLGESRAKAIKGFLVARGVDSQRLKPKSCLDTGAAAPADSDGASCATFRVLGS